MTRQNEGEGISFDDDSLTFDEVMELLKQECDEYNAYERTHPIAEYVPNESFKWEQAFESLTERNSKFRKNLPIQ